MVWWNKDREWRNRDKMVGKFGVSREALDDERGRKWWNRRKKLGTGQR